jgi:diguanylate cyclase (GGDEF)-like protein
MSTILLTSYLVQAAGALFAAILFGFFSRAYQRSFLTHWARSWAAVCVMLVGGALGASISAATPATAPSRLVISATSSVAAYMAIAWLLVGTHELAYPESAARLRAKRAFLYVGAVVVGLLSTVLFINDPAAHGLRFFVRVGVRSLAMSLAFFAAALAIVRASRVGETARSLGRALTGFAFTMYAGIMLHLAWGVLFRSPAVGTQMYTIFSGFTAFVLVFTIGLGVVIWLLEEEHAIARDTSAKVAQLAFHDPLTQLPTRKLLLDHLSMAIPKAKRDRSKLAVYFIDLDRFKNINDSLGHSFGDKLLLAVSARVRGALREADMVARMGGDEFVVLTPDIKGVDDTVHIAQKIRDAMREPVQIEGRELFVTASMGIAIYPNDGDTAETLLKNADTAMYRAKAQGSDAFQLYTPEMNAHAVEQLALESALRRAVDAKEFELHFQPIVQTADTHVVTLEAMLRWRHPVLGLVRPEQFLRLAEASGLIVSIGEWALRTACRSLMEWRAGGYPDLRVAVNISSRQLKQADFVDKVRIIMAEHAMPANALELEITEMNATQSAPEIIERLRTLRAMGVRISIDDFGTGFSSVSVLRHFPVDALKIDTSFVRDLMLDPNDAAVAAAVVALARAMGLQVVAEGVENPAQLEFLRMHGCEMLQGYLCCPPVIESEVRTVLGRRSSQALRRLSTPVDVEAVKH